MHFERKHYSWIMTIAKAVIACGLKLNLAHSDLLKGIVVSFPQMSDPLQKLS